MEKYQLAFYLFDGTIDIINEFDNFNDCMEALKDYYVRFPKEHVVWRRIY